MTVVDGAGAGVPAAGCFLGGVVGVPTEWEWVGDDPGEDARSVDRGAREALGVSGAEFVRRWDAGEWRDERGEAGRAAAWLSILLTERTRAILCSGKYGRR